MLGLNETKKAFVAIGDFLAFQIVEIATLRLGQVGQRNGFGRLDQRNIP